MSPSDFKLSLDGIEADLVRIRATGVLARDRCPNPDLFRQLLGADPDPHSRRLLVDMEQTDYIDTFGLSWLIEEHLCCQRAGGRLVLHSVHPRVMDILRFVRFDRTLYIAADLKAARVMALEGGQS